MAKDVLITPASGKLEVKADNGTTVESLIQDGNIVLTGTLTASGYNDSNWNTGYTYSTVGHLPLSGGTMTGTLTLDGDGAVLHWPDTSGTLASRGGFADAIGYNGNYGMYIGGGTSNATRYVYAGGYFYDGTTVQTLLHSGNYSTYANLYSHPTHPGDDISVDTTALTGATVISDLDFNVTTDTLGPVTDANGTVATRTLTLANLGYTGATNANYIPNNNQLTNGAGYVTTSGWTSSNDGSGSGLDADLLDGLQLSGTGTQNGSHMVLRTDVNGYANFGWINTVSGSNDGTVPNKFYASNDSYIRYYATAYMKNYMGLTHKYTDSRENQSTNTNYWVGSMGWGTTNLDTVFDWGSGWWDAWSLDGHNEPAGTTHFTGFNSLHHTGASGTSRHGWQMTMGAGNTSLLFVRGVWGGGFTGWATVYTSSNLSLATLGYTGATNANYITNNNATRGFQSQQQQTKIKFKS